MPDALLKSLPLHEIKPRPRTDTRRLSPDHVVGLAESIAALGLIEPVVVDRNDVLLAGGHRLAACRLVAVDDPGERLALLVELCGELPARIKADLVERTQTLERLVAVEPVPVRIVDIDADAEPDRAMAIEVAENTQRRDYKPAEVRQLYEELLEKGFTDREGKPKRGERAARPAIAVIIGRSLRTVRRLLNEAEHTVNRTSAGLRALEGLQRALTRTVETLREPNGDGQGTTAVRALRQALEDERLQALVRDAVDSLRAQGPESRMGHKSAAPSRREIALPDRRSQRSAAPTGEQLAAWADAWGVELPRSIDGRRRWERYEALVIAAAKKHGLDLAKLGGDHFRAPGFPAAAMISEAVPR